MPANQSVAGIAVFPFMAIQVVMLLSALTRRLTYACSRHDVLQFAFICFLAGIDLTYEQ